jgi:predicted O-methyltransferase YrrM
MLEKDLNKIYRISLENNIPILDKNTALFICDLINKRNIKTILEIGSGIGYSSSFFIFNCPQLELIDSVEKSMDRFNIAAENKISDKINFINSSFPAFEPTRKYDFIFLDGPKASIYEQVQFFKKFINKNGIIIIDNINLKRLNLEKKNSLKLFKKMELNKKTILNEFPSAQFINIEDGIIIIYF